MLGPTLLPLALLWLTQQFNGLLWVLTIYEVGISNMQATLLPSNIILAVWRGNMWTEEHWNLWPQTVEQWVKRKKSKWDLNPWTEGGRGTGRRGFPDTGCRIPSLSQLFVHTEDGKKGRQKSTQCKFGWLPTSILVFPLRFSLRQRNNSFWCWNLSSLSFLPGPQWGDCKLTGCSAHSLS